MRRHRAEPHAAHLLINPAYHDLLAANGLATFEALMNHTGGDVLRTLASRDNIRLALEDPTGRRVLLYAKRHRPPPWRELVYRVMSGRAPSSYGRREWEAVGALEAGGIPTAERVAMGERRRGPFGRESVFVAAALEGYQPADDVLKDMTPEARRPLLDAIAGLARQFHDAGFNHRDFYLCHVFVRRPDLLPTPSPFQGEGGVRVEGFSSGHPRPLTLPSPRRGEGEILRSGQGCERLHAAPATFDLAFIDLQRVERFRRRRWVVKDVAQLAYSARGIVSEEEWERWLCRYLETACLDGWARRFAASVGRKADRIARHDRSVRARRMNAPADQRR